MLSVMPAATGKSFCIRQKFCPKAAAVAAAVSHPLHQPLLTLISLTSPLLTTVLMAEICDQFSRDY